MKYLCPLTTTDAGGVFAWDSDMIRVMLPGCLLSSLRWVEHCKDLVVGECGRDDGVAIVGDVSAGGAC